MNCSNNVCWKKCVGSLTIFLLLFQVYSLVFNTPDFEDNDYTNSSEEIPLSEQQLINIESIKFQSYLFVNK